MKHFIIIFLALCSINCSYSQNTEPTSKKLNYNLLNNVLQDDVEIIGIDKLNLETSDKIKKPLVEKLKGFQYFEHIINNYETFKNSLKTVDLNGDGLLDIFYSGYLGGAADSYSFIFLNNGDAFNLVFEGEIGSEFIYAVKKSGKISGLIYYFTGSFAPVPLVRRLDILSCEELNVKSVNLAKYFDDIKYPQKYLEKPIKFKVLNSKYHLRSSPFVDNEKNKSYRVGNIISTYKSNNIGKAITKNSDDTGRVWWFVIMEDNHCGWMSSRYLSEFN